MKSDITRTDPILFLRALTIKRELGSGFANLHNIEVNMNI